MNTYESMNAIFTGDLLQSTNDHIYVEYAQKRMAELEKFLEQDGLEDITDLQTIKAIDKLHDEYCFLSAWTLWYGAQKNPETLPESLEAYAREYRYTAHQYFDGHTGYNLFKKYRVEADSIEDFIKKYGKHDRYYGRGKDYMDVCLQSHKKDFEKYGYDFITHHSSKTGDTVAYYG